MRWRGKRARRDCRDAPIKWCHTQSPISPDLPGPLRRVRNCLDSALPLRPYTASVTIWYSLDATLSDADDDDDDLDATSRPDADES